MTPLRAALEAAASADEVCDFCDARPAADMDVLLELLVAGLKSEYGDEGTIAANDDSGAATRLVVDTSGDRIRITDVHLHAPHGLSSRAHDRRHGPPPSHPRRVDQRVFAGSVAKSTL
jgi:hypothetical protein